MGHRHTRFLVVRSQPAVGFLIVALCGLSLALSQASRAQVEDGGDLRISVEFEKVSVDEAIETLAELTGRAIDVTGVPEDRQVSLT